MNRAEFIAVVAPVAVKVRVEGGILFPSVSIAQSILETGGTIHEWNNIVGYKVGNGKRTPYWDGRSVSRNTWEVYDGVRYDGVPADWRTYDSIEDSLKDQALLFITNSRYWPLAAARTPKAQAETLRATGYATDPQYADKIKAIIDQYALERFDEEALRMLERIAELEKRIAALETLAAALETRTAAQEARTTEGPPPEWAAEAVNKLVDRNMLFDPNGDRSFHRTIVMLDRAGVFDKAAK